jgi:hypothetical protein
VTSTKDGAWDQSKCLVFKSIIKQRLALVEVSVALLGVDAEKTLRSVVESIVNDLVSSADQWFVNRYQSY